MAEQGEATSSCLLSTAYWTDGQVWGKLQTVCVTGTSSVVVVVVVVVVHIVVLHVVVVVMLLHIV